MVAFYARISQLLEVNDDGFDTSVQVSKAAHAFVAYKLGWVLPPHDENHNVFAVPITIPGYPAITVVSVRSFAGGKMETLLLDDDTNQFHVDEIGYLYGVCTFWSPQTLLDEIIRLETPPEIQNNE
jgi:hypothetical protein